MGGEVGDVAANIGVEPVLRLRVKPLLNILQRRHRGRNEIALGDERRGELAAVLIQPVAAAHRDLAVSDVARTDLQDDRLVLLDPAPRSEVHTSAPQSLMPLSSTVLGSKKNLHTLSTATNLL